MIKKHAYIEITLTIMVSLMISLAWAEANVSTHVESLIGLWNGGDQSIVAELVAEDYVGHLPPSVVPTPLMGREGFSFNLGGWLAGLPDMKLELLDTVIADHKAVARVQLTATHTADFFGIPPTNQPLSFAMVFTYHFNDQGLFSSPQLPS